MDLRTKAVAATAFLHLKDANEVPMLTEAGDKVGITMYGPGSKQYAAAAAARANRNVQRLKAKGNTDRTPEEQREEAAQHLAALTAEFHHIDRDGLEGQDLYLATYRDLEIGFVAEQAQAFVNDWSNFPKGSRTS